jgi:TolB-like protein/DNA-binding winged helix-turn-helix (wHTH) protein/tetratricopeptide (TPR) repeat protein
MILPENAPFRIGDWRIDPALDEISCDGRTIKLEPRTMCVLVCLARRAGEVVSVDDLLDAVWKDVVVTQYSVYQAVAALRRSFGDDPKAPTYIDNVPRRGYRLLAPVAVPATSPPAEAAAEPALAERSTTVVIPAHAQSGTVGIIRAPVPASWSLKEGVLVAVALVIFGTAAAYLAIGKLRISKSAVSSPTVAASPTPTAFSPPAHSIAVLPFVNMSGDKEQEYFSDGLTEELLNSLAEINELQVAARTSAFSFKGKDTDIGTIARKLNVGVVLEGSVRRSAHTIRITAQLINAVTGFHLWSKTYDRDLGDVLKLQTEIATSVASALKVTLLGDVAAKVELGGTRNPAAFDAYLRGAKAVSSIRDTEDLPAAIAAYTEAIRLDPHYALALAARSIALSGVAQEAEPAAAAREGFDKAQADARQALALAPDLAQGHLALAYVSEDTLDFTQAGEAYERALALAPGNAEVSRRSGRFAALIGHFDAGVAATRRAVVLDPLARGSHVALGDALYAARRYQEAVAAFAEVISLDPDFKATYGERGLAYYGLGDLKSARASCETKPDHWVSQWCLAVIYDKLGRHADAEAVLAKLTAAFGDAPAYQDATIYAQWGNRAQALEWLETALRLRDSGLEYLKTDPLLDPLRKEPRFQAIERELRFPS